MNRKTLVVATHNASKAGEMEEILRGGLPSWTILSLNDFPGTPEPEETGASYEQNAQIKADSAAGYTNELCIADDAGLEIDALDGAPGLYSKRFAGESMPFRQKMEKVLELLDNVTPEARTARFRCCVALAEHGKPTIVFEATCEGLIASEPRGTSGFGYDPIFYFPPLDRTFGQMSSSEKHAVSHRGQVLAQVVKHLLSIDTP